MKGLGRTVILRTSVYLPSYRITIESPCSCRLIRNEEKVARLPHPILVPAFAGRPAEKCPTNNFFVEKLNWTPPTTSHFKESIHFSV